MNQYSWVRSFPTWILGAELEEEQVKYGLAEKVWSLDKVLHVKSLSPLVKDDILYFLYLIYVKWVMGMQCC